MNKATIQEWQQLKGIGPYYAKKITAFRQKLGGFASIEQIGTTYKLPDSVYLQIQPHLSLSPVFRGLPINTATIDILAAHPYLLYATICCRRGSLISIIIRFFFCLRRKYLNIGF